VTAPDHELRSVVRQLLRGGHAGHRISLEASQAGLDTLIYDFQKIVGGRCTIGRKG
jgi:hypothetical protein